MSIASLKEAMDELSTGMKGLEAAGAGCCAAAPAGGAEAVCEAAAKAALAAI
jgi:hypothetical protein